MSYLTWQEKFTVGVPEFDEDHKQLVDLINQLHDAHAAEEPPEDMDSIFETLMDYTRHHLDREEVLMRAHDFPGYAAHKEMHEEMKREVPAFYRRYRDTGDDQVVLELLGFLTNWWHFHIMEEDRAYAPFFAHHLAGRGYEDEGQDEGQGEGEDGED